MNVLVTGGAGYVGSVVAEELLKKGHECLVLDNLQQGHREAVPVGAEFVKADICDEAAIKAVFGRFEIGAVMHMAAETVVEYSMTDPKRYFRTNITGGINLLNAMLEHDVKKFVFSSTAAVYGEPQSIPISEEHATLPINSYGESKLMFERILNWYGKAYGLKFICFRYFNACGASECLGEDHLPETHLIPNILKAALGQSQFVTVFGDDYETSDGSCIRDYVHVADIAQAHVLALQHLDHRNGNRAYNLGSSQGYSVTEVIEAARRVTGSDIPAVVQARRSGDPAILVASSAQAKADIGWQPKWLQLENIIECAWKWSKEHPDGYKS